MKKKTAITLGALVLLAGGITFGGFKIKEKKEKDKIEKILNNVLIPNAEKELNTLVLQEKDLQDSIKFYEEQIRQIDNDYLISKSDAEVIDKLLKDIRGDLDKELGKWFKAHEKYYKGEGFYDFESMPKADRQQHKYLTYDIVAKILNNRKLTIPGYIMEYHFNSKRSWYEQSPLGMPDSIYFGENSGQYSSAEDLISNLRVSIECTRPVSDREELDPGDTGEMLTGPEQEELIKTLAYFVDHIDNSQGVIKPATLQKLKVVVGALVVKSQVKGLSAKQSENVDKVFGFKKAQYDVRGRISEQQSKLEIYKNPKVVNRMYRGQRKK